MVFRTEKWRVQSRFERLKVMATFEIRTKRPMNVQGEYVDAGLSVQVSSLFSNPFDEVDKIQKAFIRVHGIDLKPEGYLSLGWLEYYKI